MDRALREFRIRGVKTNLPFLRGPDLAPGLPRRRVHDPLHRRDPRAVLVPPAPRPRHPAPELHRRRDRERQPGGGGPPRADPRPAAGDPGRPAAGPRARGHPRPPARARARGLRGLDARGAAPADDRHDLPRRPPVAAGDALPHPRPGGPGAVLRPPPVRPPLARVLGRGDVRRRDAVPARGPLGPPGDAARGRPQPAHADAAAGLQRGGLHQLPRQRGPLLRGPGGRGRHRPLPRLRQPQLGREHARRDGRGAGVGDAAGGGHLLHGRHLRPVAGQVRPRLLRPHGEGARGRRRAHPRHQGHGRPLQATGSSHACVSAPGGGRHPDPLPHPRHGRGRRGGGAGGGRGGGRRGRRGHGPDERPHVAAEHGGDRRGPARVAARHRPGARGARPGRGLLGGGAVEVRGLRERDARGHRRGLPARDARRAVHEPAPAGAGARDREPLARGGEGLRRRQPHVRRHREGDADLQGRRRPGRLHGHQRPHRRAGDRSRARDRLPRLGGGVLPRRPRPAVRGLPARPPGQGAEGRGPAARAPRGGAARRRPGRDPAQRPRRRSAAT